MIGNAVLCGMLYFNVVSIAGAEVMLHLIMKIDFENVWSFVYNLILLYKILQNT